MIKFIITSFLFLIAISTIYSQGQDPEAKALLNQIEKKYPVSKALESDFVFTMKYPQEEPVVQKGKMWQMGSNYYVETENYIFQSDSKSAYVINKVNKEVYINNINTDGELSSPAEILTFYKKAKYDYILMPDQQEHPNLTLIEFKPEDRESAYFKVKMFVNKAESRPVIIQLFEKDGSRYTLEISKINVTSTIDGEKFVFNKTKYPSFLIEDLRID